jgi:hypothetical protein
LIAPLHSWKKTELVNGLLRHFEQARQASRPTAAQEKDRAWLPAAMLFPAADPDADPETDHGDDEAFAEGDAEQHADRDFNAA